MKPIILSGVALAAATTLGVGLLSGGVSTTSERGSVLQPATAISAPADPVYGVCRGVDPECYNDEGTNGWVEGEQKRVLIWSRTAGPRHA
ncbi:MAG: hypothetical protein ABW137_30615, partial [Mycobacterium sp.]